MRGDKNEKVLLDEKPGEETMSLVFKERGKIWFSVYGIPNGHTH